MKEFVSLCLKKVPVEASVYVLLAYKYWNTCLLSLYPKLVCCSLELYKKIKNYLLITIEPTLKLVNEYKSFPTYLQDPGICPEEAL